MHFLLKQSFFKGDILVFVGGVTKKTQLGDSVSISSGELHLIASWSVYASNATRPVCFSGGWKPKVFIGFPGVTGVFQVSLVVFDTNVLEKGGGLGHFCQVVAKDLKILEDKNGGFVIWHSVLSH